MLTHAVHNIATFLSRSHLRREITVLLTVKVIVILCFFVAFFSPVHRIHPDAAKTASHLLGPQP